MSNLAVLATMGRISLNIKDGMVDSRAIGVDDENYAAKGKK